LREGCGTPSPASYAVDVDAAPRRAVFSGMPVVKVGRGNADGFTARIPPFLSGTNLTATKARLLLMACLMKCGSLPVAVNPTIPPRQNSRRPWPG
jgi:L-asparaginase